MRRKQGKTHTRTLNTLTCSWIAASLLLAGRAPAQIPSGCQPSSASTQFADVTGDGKADAILVDTPGITVLLSTVLLYNSPAFLSNGNWTSGPYYGIMGTYFADVTGDGKADAIAVNPSGITVRPSSGTEFLPNEIWTSGPYWGNIGTYFANVTGDGKADAIGVNTSGITVRPSNGSEFLPNETWMTSSSSYPPTNGCTTYFADVNGDEKADAVFVCASGILVSLATGASFAPSSPWTLNPYYGNVGTYFADVTGNGLADAIAVNTNTDLTVRLSNGDGFGPNQVGTDIPYYGDVYPACYQ
jgi:FG-GAP-like repeat